MDRSENLADWTRAGPACYDHVDPGKTAPDELTKEILGGSSIGFSTWTSRTTLFPWSQEVANQHGHQNIERTRTYGIDVWTQCQMEKRHPLHNALYLWQRSVLPNTELAMLCDRPAMAFSLESRTPYLDHLLVDYVNLLPPSLKVRWMPEKRAVCTKYILRKACEDLVTDEVLRREKQVCAVVVSTSQASEQF